MKEFIALDCHRRYSLGEREPREGGGRARQRRIEHRPGAIKAYLADVEPGTPVAVEATGNWYWIINEIEAAGSQPLLVHPRKAKLMLGSINKTDQLDVHGLNRLQRAGTLPTVWVPPGELRDLRELTRTRLVLTRQRTRLKNRLNATLAKHGLSVEGFSDMFGVSARPELQRQIARLPEHARWVSGELLEQLGFVQASIGRHERQFKQQLKRCPAMQRLTTLPGVAEILAATILWELGDVNRFASAERLASYAGTTPRVHASGGRTRYGQMRPDVNRYLKWAFMEAANATVLNRRRYPQRKVSQIYERLAKRKGHAKAVGAIARHLAEASYHVLKREENYREPTTG